MSAFYERMAGVANTLIDRFGCDVELDRTDHSSDPVTGEYEEPAETILETRGILKNFDMDDVDGVTILASDRLLIIDNTVEPLKTDRPIVENVYIGEIVNIKKVSPAGVPLVYFLQVRN